MANIVSRTPGQVAYRDGATPLEVEALAPYGCHDSDDNIYTDDRILFRQPIGDDEWAATWRTTEWIDYTGATPAPDFFILGKNWVMSQRAFDIFKSFGCLEYCQIVELDPIVGAECVENVDYWYVHVKDRIPAIDVEASADLEPSEAAIKYGGNGFSTKKSATFEQPQIAIKASVVGDRHCWFEKLTVTGHNMFVSDALRDAWLEAGCGPIYFRQCQLVDDRVAAAAE